MSKNTSEIISLAEKVKEALEKRGWMIVAAESCTGGLLAGALTSLAGSSKTFERGFVTYSNQSKVELLGVSAKLVENKGAVSAEVAVAMAKGALQRAQTQIAVAVTGIAGPDGGTKDKPVGRVHIAVAIQKLAEQRQFDFGNLGRENIRQKAIVQALSFILDFISLRF